MIATTTTTPPTTKKYRMLFLHGMFGCPRIYRDTQLVQFLQTLSTANWEVVFVQSPRVCQGTPPPFIKTMFPDLQPEEMCEWVNSKELLTTTSSETTTTKEESKVTYTKEYEGLEDTLTFLQSYLTEQPRFDVIAGHSNGALMASILAFYQEHQPGWLPPPKHCRGVLCMNAPNSYNTERCLGPLVAHHGPVQAIPSLHVLGGPTDFTYEGSQTLQRVHHPGSKVLEHTAGHFFPTEQHYYDDICDALQDMMEASTTTSS
jgi:hypothetical protein